MVLEFITVVENLTAKEALLNSGVTNVTLADMLSQIKSPFKFSSAAIDFTEERHFE